MKKPDGKISRDWNSVDALYQVQQQEQQIEMIEANAIEIGIKVQQNRDELQQVQHGNTSRLHGPAQAIPASGAGCQKFSSELPRG